MPIFEFADFPDTSADPLEVIASGVIALTLPDEIAFTLTDLSGDGQAVSADFQQGQNVFEYDFTGTDFAYDGDRIVSGRIDTMSLTFNGVDVAFADNLGIEVADIIQQAQTREPLLLIEDIIDLGWTAIGSAGGDVFGSTQLSVNPDGTVTPDGDDTVDGRGGDDLLFLFGGDDVGRGGSGSDVIQGGAGNDRLFGGGGNDTLFGGAGRDFVNGGGGNDAIRGGGGNDRLVGRAGADDIAGNGGNDVLIGNAGSDVLSGGGRSDVLRGQRGNDTLDGGRGRDTLDGGKGSDLLKGGALADILRGGGQGDRLFGNNGADRLAGGAGNDALFGGRGADQLFGGGRSDRLDGGVGNDVLDGGRGRDTFVFTAGGADRITDFEVGIDTIDLSGVDGVQDAVDRNAGALIRFDGGRVLVLGVDADDLGADDLIF